MDEKKTIYSGIQPTGIITIGNYIGAISNWLKLGEEYDSIYSIVDLHSLTVRQEPAEFRKRALSFYAQYLASGLDPDKSVIYFQSHVPAHCELQWILNCYTYVGEMQRMTQFKEKSSKNKENINMGLLDYPVLMASDILLYQTALVPIGADQKQHVEIARDIALRFNNTYGNVFTVPEPVFGKVGAKIYSLQEPTAKMSKSDPDPNAAVSIIEDKDSIMRKFKRAVTDSDTEVRYAPKEKPGVSNLITIMSVMTGKTVAAIEKEYGSTGYQRFKNDVGESVCQKFEPIKEKYNQIMADKEYLTKTIRTGAEKAAYLAERTMRKVRKKIGLLEK